MGAMQSRAASCKPWPRSRFPSRLCGGHPLSSGGCLWLARRNASGQWHGVRGCPKLPPRMARIDHASPILSIGDDRRSSDGEGSRQRARSRWRTRATRPVRRARMRPRAACRRARRDHRALELLMSGLRSRLKLSQVSRLLLWPEREEAPRASRPSPCSACGAAAPRVRTKSALLAPGESAAAAAVLAPGERTARVPPSTRAVCLCFSTRTRDPRPRDRAQAPAPPRVSARRLRACRGLLRGDGTRMHYRE